MNKPAKKPEAAQVLHAKGGDKHVVGVKALKVLLLKDGAGWFAQGLEIDYASSGGNLEEVKKNFEDGLAMTIKEHLVMYGTVDKLLKVAPQEAWKEYFDAPADDALQAKYYTIQAYDLVKKAIAGAKIGKAKFPFDVIQFIQPEAVAA